MYKNKKILALIPARGGSKGLPGKNIKVLMDKPLIGWTIAQAKACRYIDRIFVSTDSQEIADVCSEYGADVPSLRPGYLAQDGSSTMDVMKYTLKLLEEKGEHYDYLLLLEPTSPLRKPGDLDSIIEIGCSSEEADGVISVGRVHTEHPSIVKKISVAGYVSPYIESDKIIYQRQQEDEALFPYGVGYLVKVESFLESASVYMDKMLPYRIERWQNYEIDDIYDFIAIEAVMKKEHNRYE